MSGSSAGESSVCELCVPPRHTKESGLINALSLRTVRLAAFCTALLRLCAISRFPVAVTAPSVLCLGGLNSRFWYRRIPTCGSQMLQHALLCADNSCVHAVQRSVLALQAGMPVFEYRCGVFGVWKRLRYAGNESDPGPIKLGVSCPY